MTCSILTNVLIGLVALAYFNYKSTAKLAKHNGHEGNFDEDQFLNAEPITDKVDRCRYPGNFQRVNKSRFFIVDNLPRKDVESNWDEAVAFCKKLEKSRAGGKWRLARIEHLTTFRMIATFLEDLYNRSQVEQNKALNIGPAGKSWKDTWYWIDAYFDPEHDQYYNSDKEPLKFNTVFFYRSTRPLGIGAHVIHNVSYNHTVASTKRYIQQCLTMALPWPNRVEQGIYSKQFGHQASFDERACEAVQKFKPMCESLDPKCDTTGNFKKERDFLYFNIEGYAQRDYVDDGMWIFANRRFLVNLKPRKKVDAVKFCKENKTKLYTPRLGDDCLIPYLKMWNIRQTHLHFWTSLKAKYDGKPSGTQMMYENGTIFSLYNADDMSVRNFSYQSRIDKKVVKSNYSNLGVTANWAYEYPNETACADCDWNFMTFAIASVRLFMGTICEPLVYNEDEHKCNWKAEWTKDIQQGVDNTAVVEFGYKGSGYYRSTYKQQFGQRICVPPGHSPDKEHTLKNQVYWHLPNNMTIKSPSIYYYDFVETYWVLDSDLPEKDRFKYAGKDTDKCWVSKAKVKSGVFVRDVNGLRQVNCLEWHFYLCGPEDFIEYYDE